MKKGMIFGMILALLIGFALGFFTLNFINEHFEKDIRINSKINLEINGDTHVPKDENNKKAYAFIYRDTIYVPIMLIEDFLYENISWKEKSKTLIINERPNIPDTSDSENDGEDNNIKIEGTENSDNGEKEDDENNDENAQNINENGIETVPDSRQSKLMLEKTGKKWSPELEDALKDVDFSQYNLNTKEIKEIKNVNDIFVLANKFNKFPDDFKPQNLVKPETPYFGYGENYKLRKVAADALDKLCKDAKKANLTINNVSAYRSIDYQRDLYKSNVKQKGEEHANKFSSKPGHSEHHTGLCTDVSSPIMNHSLEQNYIEKPEGKWLAENAHKYGFIIRYPKGKANLTGYEYEPWHIRYLGVPLATYLYETELTYEEFLALQVAKTKEQIIIED